MVYVYASNSVDVGILWGGCTVDTCVVADIGAIPVWGEVFRVRGEGLFPCLECCVGFDESWVEWWESLVWGVDGEDNENGKDENWCEIMIRGFHWWQWMGLVLVLVLCYGKMGLYKGRRSFESLCLVDVNWHYSRKRIK